MAKPTSESAELTPAILGTSEVSFDDFEVLEVPDEEMVDYEATLKRAEVNVVVLSVDNYIVADDSTTAEFNFATESAIF